MRLRSDVWVSALIRRHMAEGAFAAVLRKGSPEAGAIFVTHRKAATISIYAPAPQALAGESPGSDRPFELRLAGVEPDEAEAWLAGQVRFDPDCWIVEIERPDDALGLEIVAE